jgi:hypothetical protein
MEWKQGRVYRRIMNMVGKCVGFVLSESKVGQSKPMTTRQTDPYLCKKIRCPTYGLDKRTHTNGKDKKNKAYRDCIASAREEAEFDGQTGGKGKKDGRVRCGC